MDGDRDRQLLNLVVAWGVQSAASPPADAAQPSLKRWMRPAGATGTPCTAQGAAEATAQAAAPPTGTGGQTPVDASSSSATQHVVLASGPPTLGEPEAIEAALNDVSDMVVVGQCPGDKRKRDHIEDADRRQAPSLAMLSPERHSALRLVQRRDRWTSLSISKSMQVRLERSLKATHRHVLPQTMPRAWKSRISSRIASLNRGFSTGKLWERITRARIERPPTKVPCYCDFKIGRRGSRRRCDRTRSRTCRTVRAARRRQGGAAY